MGVQFPLVAPILMKSSIIQCREDGVLVHQMGYESVMLGKTIEENPFEELLPEWYMWRAGWILGNNTKHKELYELRRTRRSRQQL